MDIPGFILLCTHTYPHICAHSSNYHPWATGNYILVTLINLSYTLVGTFLLFFTQLCALTPVRTFSGNTHACMLGPIQMHSHVLSQNNKQKTSAALAAGCGDALDPRCFLERGLDILSHYSQRPCAHIVHTAINGRMGRNLGQLFTARRWEEDGEVTLF